MPEPALTPPSLRVVAKILWVAPALLLFLAINQIWVAFELKSTLENGKLVTANVTEYDKVDRADITYGFVSLSIPLEDGSTLIREKLSLPYTLLPYVENKEELEVIIMPGASQEIVIASIASAQWKMAAIQSLMAFGAFVLFAVGVRWWNRFLLREGDPAYRQIAPAKSPLPIP